MLQQLSARILENKLIAGGTHSLWLECPEIAAQAEPGQFLHILCGSKSLRRPISICSVSAKEINIVFAVRGEGTQWLSARRVGEVLNVIGALGKGFPILKGGGRLLLLGGGIGVPPLLDCALRCGAESVDAVLGFRSAEQIILGERFKDAGASVTVCTEDGSYGNHGLLTVPSEELLKKNDYASVYACGPVPMLKAAAGLAQKYSVPCWLSLEERMGCAVGACLVCAVKIKAKNASEDYLRVCKDGPVFNAEEVCWE